MAIFEVVRSSYPNAEDQGKVLGTLHFAEVSESLEDKITGATVEFKRDFESGILVTLCDALALPDTIVQLVEQGSQD